MVFIMKQGEIELWVKEHYIHLAHLFNKYDAGLDVVAQPAISALGEELSRENS